jgi:hypothetical protein
VGAVGEERELLMALALNRSRVASQRDLAVAWWGPAEVMASDPAAALRVILESCRTLGGALSTTLADVP